MLRRIKEVTTKNAHLLELVFVGGEPGEVDLAKLLDAGGVWSAIRDPAAFAQVRVSTDGRYVEWPGELDLCADALWIQAHEKEAVK